MLQAYVDGSGTGDPNELILAGYVATAETWREFSREWKSCLDEANLPYFKMNEMTSRPELAAYFYRVIERHEVLAALSVTIDTAALRKVVREIVPAPDIRAEKLENPYFFAFRAMIECLAALQDKIGISEPVDFIFDDESEKVRILPIWELVKDAMRPDIRERIGSNPIFREDHKFMPLQAADLYAWWVRRWHRDGRKDRLRVPFAWKENRQIAVLHMELDEGTLRTSFERSAKQIQAMRSPVQKSAGIKMTLPDPSSKWRE
jgi:hypothetical protein